MPLVDWSDPAEWTRWYGASKDGVTVGYGRDWATGFGTVPVDQGKVASLVDRYLALGVESSDRVLIAGCGFGFTIEALHGRGFPNVWGIDSSSHIASNRGTEAVGSTLWVEDDIRGGGQVRNALKSMAGLSGNAGFDWVISESVLESYSDAEIPQLLNAAEAILDGAHPTSRVVHIVFEPPFDPSGVLNEKTLSEWNAVRPAHTWMNAQTGETL